MARVVDEAARFVQDADVRRLQEAIVERGGRTAGVKRQDLKRLLATCPDVDLAATAVMMEPRPGWLAAILGA